jgi:hypothetical protein
VHNLIDATFPLPHICADLPCIAIPGVVVGSPSSLELRLARTRQACSIALPEGTCRAGRIDAEYSP